MPGCKRLSAKVFVTDQEGNILLARRTEQRDRGKYDIPGGGVDKGETLTEAAIKELREEVGLLAKAEDIQQLSQEPFRMQDGSGNTVEMYFFTWQYDGQEIVLGGGDLAPDNDAEHDDYFWGNLETVCDRSDIQLTDKIREAIDRFREDIAKGDK